MTDARTPQLGDALKAERRKRRLSLREVSYETGISVNTLSRVERGYLPDLKNYQRLVDWLGVLADTFLENTQPDNPAGTLDLVARHFRSDQSLTPEAAERLTSLVRDMYSKLVSERPRLAVHMRSAKTFTPAAGALLADILSEMQAALETEETRLTMRRGFKAEAERLATQVRNDMGIGPYKPLDIHALVEHVGAQLRMADELTSLTKLQELDALQPGAFSACTFDFGTRKIIVISPLASDERQRSDATHEASHLLLNHSVKEIEQLGGLSFFTCDPDEEQEANWLAGCILLPRDMLVQLLKRGMDVAAIAEANAVSLQMASFRLRATGAERQAATWH